MKKLFASLTALSFVGCMMTAFPAKADTLETFIVVAVDNPENPGNYILTSTYRGDSYSVAREEFVHFSGYTPSGTVFSVGDVLEFLNVSFISTNLGGTNGMSHLFVSSPDVPIEGMDIEVSGSITKTGSIIENPEIQEFTVAEEYITKSYYLTDEADSYEFHLDWNTASYYQPDKFEYDFLQVGDTVSCYTYYGRPYIMINPQEDVFEDYLIAGVGQENYVLMGEYGSTYYVNKESLDSYLFTNFKPEFGDVLRFRNLYLYVSVIPFEACTVYADIEEVYDYSSAPAIAEHAHVYNRPENYQIFDVTNADAHSVTLSDNDKRYCLFTDWIDEDYPDAYKVHSYFQKFLLTREDLLNQQTVTCLTWNGTPIIPVQDEIRDKTEIAYVLGVDNPDNPQQYVLTNVNGIGGLSKTFTAEELAPYLGDSTLKLGDTLILRNVEFYFDVYSPQTNLDIRPYADVQEGRPLRIDVTGSLLDYPAMEFTLFGIYSSYAKVKSSTGREYTLYFMPDGITTFPAPDTASLNQGDTVTCIVTENNIPLMLYNPEQSKITPNGDADGSGKLDILDVITVNRAVLGKEKFPSERIPYIDFNGNGIPDFDDSLTMMRMIVGLI